MKLLETIFVASLFLTLSSTQEDIRLPPSIVKSPPKDTVIYRSDDRVTLECKGKGVPYVTYEWKKNGFELNLNLNNIRKGADGTITIQPATSMDEGFYQCFVKNQYGTALSNTTHIRRAVLDSASGTPSTNGKTIGEGQPFVIQADPRRSFPKPTYGWELANDAADKNPISLRPSTRIQISENGDLHFAYALPEDALDGRIYKCTIYNPVLDVKAGGSYTNLTVTRNPAGLVRFAPTLGFSSAKQTVALIGGSVKLRCFFYGNGAPTISWSGPKNSLPIGRYALYSFNTEFIIRAIAAHDEGDYSCTASNTEGRTTHILQIRVEAVPRFLAKEDGPHDVNVTEGESYNFNCRADAKPDATIVWFQNGRQLDTKNPLSRFVFSSDMKTLTIRDVCRDCVDRESKTDLMVIQCNASNIHGYAFAQGYLNVLKKTVVAIHNKTEVAINTNEAGQVKFECRTTSDRLAPPRIRWFRVTDEGDEPIHDDPPFVTVHDGLLSINVATNAAQNWPKYLGQYRCVVETGHSRVSRTANITAIVTTRPVTVRKPPRITKQSPTSIIYRSFDNVELVCEAEGIPDVTYEWKKNGFELNQNIKNIHKIAVGTIAIQPATSLDEGFYQCFARNQYGTALSNTTHIRRALLDYFTTGTLPTLQKTIVEGQPFVIQANPVRSFPEPTYGWEMAADIVDKNPVPLRASKRIQIADNGDLHFAYVLHEDDLAGRLYKCTTYNPYLDVKAGGSYTKLTVTISASGITQFPPTLGFSSETRIVALIGRSVTLRCFFYGNPEPTITWTGPRNTLPIGRYTLGAFNTELTINSITPSDEGDYSCTGSNTQGRNTHVLRMRVEAVPRFLAKEDGPYDVNVTEGESATFHCKSDAKPEAKIVWLQDGSAIDIIYPPRRFAFSRDKRSLKIINVCRDCEDRQRQTDLMVIQCNASNVHGYAFAQGYLNVLSKESSRPNATRNNTGRKVKKLTTKVISYLMSAYMADSVFPDSRLRTLSGLIYEVTPDGSRDFISAMRRKIPAMFDGRYSVVVFDASKATNISGAMDISLREAEQRGPTVLLVDNLDILYPKASANEAQRKAEVEKLLQSTSRALSNAFVLFLGFVANLENLNPDMIQSGLFASA